jgi:hypothetical protein
VENFALYLYEALAAPVGIILSASDPVKCRQKLYAARAKVQDPALSCLQIRLVEMDGGNIVITKGKDNSHA